MNYDDGKAPRCTACIGEATHVNRISLYTQLGADRRNGVEHFPSENLALLVYWINQRAEFGRLPFAQLDTDDFLRNDPERINGCRNVDLGWRVLVGSRRRGVPERDLRSQQAVTPTSVGPCVAEITARFAGVVGSVTN